MYFTRKELDEFSPSRRDNITKEKERELKTDVTTFLQECGKGLKLPQITIATSIVYLHKFFLAHSINKYDKYLVGTSCLFLASKVEENTQKLKEVIWKFINLISKRRKVEEIPQNKEQYFVSQAFKNLKQQILNFESLLLRTLAFDLRVVHPYGTLLNNLKTLDPENKQLAQVSWNFINDSLQRTNLCLQYKPEYIAPAAIFLAAKIINHQIPEKEGKKWWEFLKIPLETLTEISDQILELYENDRLNLTKIDKREDNQNKNTVPKDNQITQNDK
eukprot:TRINITY_DN5196_c0_g1_i2.p1 TRINITY_DN5196_c0_g1~~TRINITY_DN5196_c0_g1_i2.p1  ORF type:complete len:275 (-),score=64.44 TRINITY_DN5196_c0_g1_i2:16-840(-)